MLEIDDVPVDVVFELVAGCVVELVATVVDVAVLSFDVASRSPPMPAVAITAIDPIDTMIFVAVFKVSPPLTM